VRVLVLGGTAFIGPWAVRALCAKGHEVTVFHRGSREADLPPEVAHLHGDRARLEEHREQFAALAPEVVLDMRCLSEADARRAIETFRGIARRTVMISSIDVYRAYGVLLGKEPGPPEPMPQTEDAPLRTKLYPYRSAPPRADDDPLKWQDNYDKIPAEQAFLAEPEMPGTVVRLPMVYGPGDYQHRIFHYLKRMQEGRPAILIPEAAEHHRVPRGYVESVGAGIALAIETGRAAGRSYHIADAAAPTESEWIRAIAETVGWRGEIVPLPPERLPEHLTTPVNFDQDWVLDTSRIREELGYDEVVSFGEGVRRTAEWERANPAATIDPAAYDYEAEDRALGVGG
jgi:nucleoside-diphosphate-sugar epimerase